jgi:hypothetical protein
MVFSYSTWQFWVAQILVTNSTNVHKYNSRKTCLSIGTFTETICQNRCQLTPKSRKGGINCAIDLLLLLYVRY